MISLGFARKSDYGLAAKFSMVCLTSDSPLVISPTPQKTRNAGMSWCSRRLPDLQRLIIVDFHNASEL